ncbi:MAG: helix-turn-helix domain-containing protein [Anaeroplasma bactoclasticum]|nr:helix-turn-helix domain-containing protein [Anaeroplasma bactoclasticum]
METLEKITIILNELIKNKKTITQKELADKLNVTPASVNKWLNGGSIEVDKIPLLCETLKITPNDLFGFNNTEFSDDDISILKELKKRPKYKDAIRKLLDM